MGLQAQAQPCDADRWRFIDASSIARNTPRCGIEKDDFACAQNTEDLLAFLIARALSTAAAEMYNNVAKAAAVERLH